jgi:hypothetical protein
VVKTNFDIFMMLFLAIASYIAVQSDGGEPDAGHIRAIGSLNS